MPMYWWPSLVIPEVIKEEWNRHKKDKADSFKSSWNSKQKSFNEVAQRLKLHSIVDNIYDISFIDNQVEDIEKLIANFAIKLQVADEIKKMLPHRLINRKAPFHNKTDSMQDAYIYFSAIDYCKNNGVSEIYFFSSNKHEYGKPLPKSTRKKPVSSETEIHPELIEYYSEI